MDNNTQNNGVQETQNAQTPIDYESEYKKMLAERDSYKAEAEKQKGLKDKYASENADYKKKELDKLTDDEKKAKEYQELIDAKNSIEAELKQMRLEKEILANGFTAEECTKLMKGEMAVSVFAEILKARLEENTKSVQASLIKTTTPDAPLGNGTTSDPAKAKSDFAKFQEAKVKADTSGIVEF